MKQEKDNKKIEMKQDKDNKKKIYLLPKLQETDPELFQFSSELPYEKLCRNMPIVSDKKTKKTFEYRGKHYSCPEAICPEEHKAIPLKNLEIINKNKVKTALCPSCMKKNKEVYLLIRGEGSVYPGLLDPSRHPNGLCLPCCFQTDSTNKKSKYYERIQQCKKQQKGGVTSVNPAKIIDKISTVSEITESDLPGWGKETLKNMIGFGKIEWYNNKSNSHCIIRNPEKIPMKFEESKFYLSILNNQVVLDIKVFAGDVKFKFSKLRPKITGGKRYPRAFAKIMGKIMQSDKSLNDNNVNYHTSDYNCLIHKAVKMEKADKTLQHAILIVTNNNFINKMELNCDTVSMLDQMNKFNHCFNNIIYTYLDVYTYINSINSLLTTDDNILPNNTFINNMKQETHKFIGNEIYKKNGNGLDTTPKLKSIIDKISNHINICKKNIDAAAKAAAAKAAVAKAAAAKAAVAKAAAAAAAADDAAFIADAAAAAAAATAAKAAADKAVVAKDAATVAKEKVAAAVAATGDVINIILNYNESKDINIIKNMNVIKTMLYILLLIK